MSSNEIVVEEDRITASLKEADELRKGLNDDQIKVLRNRAKHDLFWLGTGVLGFKDLSPNLHGHLSTWMTNRITDRFRLILLPRSHFKSTIATVTDSLQIVLPDDLQTAPYPRNLGVDARVLLAHEADENAKGFLSEITNHVLTNPMLMMLFPEIVPQYKRHKINSSELELAGRKTYNKEPTFSTMGVGSKSQGKHFHFIKLDDIYGKDARDSIADRKAVIKWFNNIQSFLITPKTDKIDLIGTRWAHDDIYRHAMDVYGSDLFRYIRPIWKEVKGKKEFIFPERFDMAAVKQLMQDPEVWNAQYLNNPEEGTNEFDPSYLRTFNWSSDKKQLIVFTGYDEPIRYDVAGLDKMIFIDPATTGLTGYVVTGTDSNRKHAIFTLEATKKTFSTNELLEKIFSDVLKYRSPGGRPPLVVIEEVLFSKVYQDYITTEMQHRGIRFTIEGAKTYNKDKELRIKALAPYYAAGQIHHCVDQTDIITEFNHFGRTKNIHLLDAMAYGPRYWRSAIDLVALAVREQANAKFNQMRDQLTGYSKVSGDNY